MSTGKVVIGTIAGLAIGAIGGILFAPEKGSRTRQQIVDKGDEYVDEIKSKYGEISDSLTDKFGSTKRDVENLAEKGKAKYNEVKKDVKNTASNFEHDAAADIKHATS